MRAAVQVLREKGAEEPEKLVFGVDVDKDCVKYARGLIAAANCVRM